MKRGIYRFIDEGRQEITNYFGRPLPSRFACQDDAGGQQRSRFKTVPTVWNRLRCRPAGIVPTVILRYNTNAITKFAARHAAPCRVASVRQGFQRVQALRTLD